MCHNFCNFAPDFGNTDSPIHRFPDLPKNIMEYLSQERYNEIAEELEHLIKVDFPRLTQELAEARAQGDLSENFEYHACKREQGKMMSRIRFLQHVLEYAKVIDTTLLSADTVGLFRKVTVTNLTHRLIAL